MPFADRMRELLARTVHDHIVEERTVAGALQEIPPAAGRHGRDERDGDRGQPSTAWPPTLGTLDSKLTARLETPR